MVDPASLSSGVDAAYASRKLFASFKKAAWITATTVLVLLMPLIIEMDREQSMFEIEKEQMNVLTGSTAASLKAAGLAKVLALYREVLRVHRHKLPGPMRSLGDSYAHHEFSSHLKAKTTRAQWTTFGKEWQSYVAMLRGQGDAGGSDVTRSGDMPHEVLSSMSPEQQGKLLELENEMRMLGKPRPE